MFTNEYARVVNGILWARERTSVLPGSGNKGGGGGVVTKIAPFVDSEDEEMRRVCRVLCVSTNKIAAHQNGISRNEQIWVECMQEQPGRGKRILCVRLKCR